MYRVKILLVISAFLILFGSVLQVYLKVSRDESVVNNEIPSNSIIIDRSGDTAKDKVLRVKKWFPIPITSIERSGEKMGKYFIVLENGMGFYTNTQHNMSDTIFWMDEEGKMVTKIPK